MDRTGIDMQVISPYPGHFVYAAPAEVARDSCHLVNNHIAEMVAKHPDRLMGMGTVPLQDPGMALAELNRTVKELGFRGVELCTNVRGVDLTRAGLEKFFARVEELGLLIFLHPSGTSLVGRMSDHYFPNIDRPSARFSALRRATDLRRLSRAFPETEDLHCPWRRLSAGLLGTARPRLCPSRGLPRQHQQAAVGVSEEALFRHGRVRRARARHLIEIWGADHIMLGTDYPFDMAEPDPVGLLGRVKGVSKDDMALVAGGNAARLLGLPA